MRILSKHWIYLLLILFFSVLGMKALFHPGLFTAHDIWHQVARIYHYSQAVNDGQFPPYWISTLANGLGYPLFFFSYHFPWILGLPFLKVGFDIPNTLKILFFLAYFFSGLFMYILTHDLLKNRLAASLSAILYLWSPYHFLTIFVGASMGIVYVFAFLPLLLLGIHRIKENKKIGIPITALGFAGIILSHLMHLFFLSPVIFIFVLWEFANTQDRTDFIKKTVFGLILGVLISTFYLMPAVYYNQFTKIHQESGFTGLYRRNFVNLSQIIYSKWEYGPIVSNAKDGDMSVQLGIAQWLSFLGILLLFILGKLRANCKSLSIFLLFGFLICIYLMLDFSLPVWQLTGKFVTLDYPFRELLGATFIGSVLGGILIANFRPVLQRIFFFLIILIALYTNRNHIRVNQYTNIPIDTYVESEMTTNSFNEYLPFLADNKLVGNPPDIIEGANLAISNVKQNSFSLSLNVNSPGQTRASIRQFYFPGQSLYINNKKIDYRIDQKGRINFNLPAGSHNIILKYEETTIIKFSKISTLIGIIILIILLIKHKLTGK